jgi:hypothetical protein
MFFRVLDVQESVPVKKRPLLRQWQIKFQQVPKPGWYGVGSWAGMRTWADVKAGAATWTDATTAYGALWADWRGKPQNVALAKTGAVFEEGAW